MSWRDLPGKLTIAQLRISFNQFFKSAKQVKLLFVEFNFTERRIDELKEQRFFHLVKVLHVFKEYVFVVRVHFFYFSTPR